VPALHKVNLKVCAGEFVSIKGRSGSGKTTLLNLIGGLDRPDEGAIFLQGRDISNLSETEMVELRRHTISFVFQSFGLLPSYSAYEIVDFALRLNGMPRKERHIRTLESLKLVGLGERLQHRPDELSGGQQQRLCIARTLAVEPEVILFDEPCSGLDPISTAKVEDAMLKLKQKYTIVLVTNNVKQAARVGNRTAFFLGGELIEIDRTEKIFTAPSDRRTDGYISGKFG